MKAKPILLVLLTLVIGFILGMLTSAQIRLTKLKPVRLFFSEERFREGFFKTIQPDEKQKAEIVQILDKYAKMNSELQNNLRKELDSKLTKEQLARLKEMDERRQDMIRQNRRFRNDTSNFHDMRPMMREGRPFPGDRPMPPGERPPLPPPDTNKLPDSK